MKLYHRVPSNLKGQTLYPLNRLLAFDSEIYQSHKRKYFGREYAMEKEIPILQNCLWNDVLFFSAVHPTKLRVAYESVGLIFPEVLQFFEFDIQELNMQETAVMHWINPPEPIVMYERFTQDRAHMYTTIPPASIEYWKKFEKIKTRERPLAFLFIPHILYRGTLDTASATIVAA